MPLLEWGPDFGLGVAELDAQHERLVQALNGLEEALTQRQGKQAFAHRLQKLVLYARSHFATEEALMEECGYADLEAHRKQHEALARRVVELKHRFEAGEAGIPIRVLTYLSEWFERHMRESDRALVESLKAVAVT